MEKLFVLFLFAVSAVVAAGTSLTSLEYSSSNDQVKLWEEEPLEESYVVEKQPEATYAEEPEAQPEEMTLPEEPVEQPITEEPPVEEATASPSSTPSNEVPEQQEGTEKEPMQDFVLEPVTEVVKNGEEGQISTIYGNGVMGQDSLHMNHPAYPQVDKKGNIYFIDGDMKHQQVRKFDGKAITTVMNLSNNKLNRTGEFWTTGLALINQRLYVSDLKQVYVIQDGRIHKAPGDFEKYMEENYLDELWLMKRQGNHIYLMFKLKGHEYTFSIAEYNEETGGITTLIDRSDYYKPFSFYVDGNEIAVATHLGDIIYERQFPREKGYVYRSGDAQDVITDVWVNKQGELMFSMHNREDAYIKYIDNNGEVHTIAGGQRGYQDGFSDEVMMDNPMDFIYDGTGYIFVDPGNHALRKLWTNKMPKED